MTITRKNKLGRAFSAMLDFMLASKGARDNVHDRFEAEGSWAGPTSVGHSGSSSTLALCHFSMWKLQVEDNKWSSIKRSLPDVIPRVGGMSTNTSHSRKSDCCEG
eukprot:CAMPEP_0184315240 /NCGR_PEP_ID=MMETSP1049-20130417/80907_1 /TAXON_ID=77928 /ORGANISM="Proteomonas sulcata, Strain CCMP704" /LENGTH=104 /DNA_ID=CAMNT_0026633603 /DNA_START=278 /DNA_END=588 /DNA_ORIENTATION=-